MSRASKDFASFRDPSGFVFRAEDGTLYRQVNRSYQSDYRLLMDSGLYRELAGNKLLIEHEEASLSQAVSDEACCVIRPRELPFVSYPYEWPFSAIKEAALLTLDIQLRALNAGLTLKDASAYNVQFDGTRPLLIDTLSFEKYEPGTPWKAYAQFCRHFLAPLALMAKVDIRFNRLLALHIDGVPLDLASRLLPFRTRLSLGMLIHVHMLAKMVARHSDTSPHANGASRKPSKVSRRGLIAIIHNLRKTVSKLTYNPSGTEWADYYQNNSYTSEAFEDKKRTVERFLDQTQPQTVWDLGANTGVFSRIATTMGARTCAFDIDPACVEMNFRECRKANEHKLLPLLLDLTNPSPAIGWAHQERRSFAERGPVDTVMALALIHHLAIGNNVPFERIAEFLRRLSDHLIIEFVPKGDPQVRRLLRSRDDVFHDYSEAGFERAFLRWFTVSESRPVGKDGRTLYLMKAMGGSTARQTRFNAVPSNLRGESGLAQ